MGLLYGLHTSVSCGLMACAVVSAAPVVCKLGMGNMRIPRIPNVRSAPDHGDEQENRVRIPDGTRRCMRGMPCVTWRKPVTGTGVLGRLRAHGARRVLALECRQPQSRMREPEDLRETRTTHDAGIRRARLITGNTGRGGHLSATAFVFMRGTESFAS